MSILTQLWNQFKGVSSAQQLPREIDRPGQDSGNVERRRAETHYEDVTPQITGALPKEFGIGEIVQHANGSYEVLSVLGGGFGNVYVVVDRCSGRVVALKTFKGSFLWNDAHRNRFEREARTWLELGRHPNVVQALGVIKVGAFPCLVMEYVPGGTLRSLLNTRRYLTPVHALRLGLQFCDGIIHAAAKIEGLVHRDIKPENCLLSVTGALKVTDFGLSRVFADAEVPLPSPAAGSIDLTTHRTSAYGTRPYMGPEQFRGEPLDVRCDIFAFGVMFWEMLTGDLPRDGRLALAMVSNGATSLRVPRSLSDLVLQCLAEEASERPSDFSEIRHRLCDVYQTLTGNVPPTAPQPTAVELSAESLVVKGAALAAFRRHTEAIRCFEQAVRIDPTLAAAWANMGVSLLELGQCEAALHAVERAVGIDSENAPIWAIKASILLDLGRFDEAAAAAQRAIRHDPRNPSAWNELGNAAVALDRPDQALSHFESSLSINPKEPSIWVSKGNALTRMGRRAEALDALQHALAIDPRYAKAWYNEGTLHLEMGHLTQARSALEASLEIDPKNADAWGNLGKVLESLGQFDKALASTYRALEINPEHGRHWYNAGCIALSMGRHEESLKALEKAVAISPDGMEAWSNKGGVLLSLGRAAEALADFDRAIELQPRNATAWCNKGCGHYSLKQYEPALAAFDHALSLDPNLAVAKENRDAVLECLASQRIPAATAAPAHDKEGLANPQSVFEMAGLMRQAGLTQELQEMGEEMYRLAKMLTPLDDPDQAIQWCTAALEFDPSLGKAWRLRAELRMRQADQVQDKKEAARIRQLAMSDERRAASLPK